MRTVALIVGGVVASILAPLAEAQVGWFGLAGGVSWTWDGDRASLARGDDTAVSLLAGISLDRDALLRLRGAELPIADPAGATMRVLAVGVDYFFPGVVGEAAFSAGLGGYRLRLPLTVRPGPGDGRWELGYYLGVGEWFSLTRRSRLTVEVTWDRSLHSGVSSLVTATAGLAVSL